jgi:TolB-like protein/DNA-binding winged helix-turn-helix (wHTH) protein/Tfp pilus assembly protein PilF
MSNSSGNLSTTLFQLDDWRVDPVACQLEKDGTEVKIEPKVMQVLVYLAEHAGEVASREALEAEIWSGLVVSYDAVSGSIIKLRKALGDDSREPRYIKTISKRGYRLIAPVTPISEPASSGPGVAAPVHSRSSFQKPGIRYASIGIGLALILALGYWALAPKIGGVAATEDKPSVIVLPFKNLSEAKGQEYISDGLTDDLITDLSRVDTLRVIAKQSSYFYKGAAVEPAEVRKQLGVKYIIEGSVRKSGNHMRINVQLTDTNKSQSVWAKRFDIEKNEILAVQDRITKEVVSAMLNNPDGAYANYRGSRGTRSFEAYDAFLLGQQYIKTRSKQGYTQTMNAYRRAIQIDPSFARAYGAMAVTLTRGYRYQWSDLSLVEARERALELAKKAVELDNSNPEIYWSLAYVHLHRREYDEAEKAVRKSIELSTNFADGYALLANIANWRGKPGEAITDIKEAMKLNPYYVFEYPSTLGLAYYLKGQYPDAVKTLDDALDRNESALNPRLFLAATYIRMHKKDDAEWEIDQVETYHPDATISNLETTLPFEKEDILQNLKTDLRKAGLKG